MKINKIPVPPPMTTAKFDSDCLGCGDEILEGDDIFLIDGEWVCELCMRDNL